MVKIDPDESEKELSILSAKHRALDMQIDELRSSYVSDSFLKRLKYEKAKLKLQIEIIKDKKSNK